MSERKFKPVGEKETIFLKPAELQEAQLEGTFLETYEGNFGPNHKFRTEGGEIVIVNGFGMLNSKMQKVDPGSFVKLDYQGKKKIVKGPLKGKEAHTVEVLIAE